MNDNKTDYKCVKSTFNGGRKKKPKENNSIVFALYVSSVD